MYTQLAAIDLFSGKPEFYTPAVIGCSPGKPFCFRVPVTGTRPIRLTAEGLPDGMHLDAAIPAVVGCAKAGIYEIRLSAENTDGKTETQLSLNVRENGVCPTPLLGWTSWNAFRNLVSDADIRNTAALLVKSGLADCGYRYVNIDSGWQGEYGGPHNALMPNEKFPDMRALADTLHAEGLCLGIYSSPMTKAWGGGEYPGCTRNPDRVLRLGVFGEERCEAENVRQWCDWQIDYLKYDWTPCNRENAEPMKQALACAARDFAFCVTVDARYHQAEYWRENVNSFRNNPDSADDWSVFCPILCSADRWLCHIRPGHFFDLDMLETAYYIDHRSHLTEDEQIAAFTARAFLSSPIQMSFDLNHLEPFDINVMANPEILALNQDVTGVTAITMQETKTDSLSIWTRVYSRPTADGNTAFALFNLGEQEAEIKVSLGAPCRIRDLWARKTLDQVILENEEMGCCYDGFDGTFTAKLMPHTVRVIKTVR